MEGDGDIKIKKNYKTYRYKNRPMLTRRGELIVTDKAKNLWDVEVLKYVLHGFSWNAVDSFRGWCFF